MVPSEFQRNIKANKIFFFVFLILSLEKESLSSGRRCASLFMFLFSRKQLNRGENEFTQTSQLAPAKVHQRSRNWDCVGLGWAHGCGSN